MSPHLDGPVEGVVIEGSRPGPEAALASPGVPDVGPDTLSERGARAGAPDELASLLTGELTALLTDELRYEMERRLAEVESLKRLAFGSEAEARRYVQATQALRAWAHGVHLAIHAAAATESPEPQHER